MIKILGQAKFFSENYRVFEITDRTVDVQAYSIVSTNDYAIVVNGGTVNIEANQIQGANQEQPTGS